MISCTSEIVVVTFAYDSLLSLDDKIRSGNAFIQFLIARIELEKQQKNWLEFHECLQFTVP